jgi:hypothetical protein
VRYTVVWERVAQMQLAACYNAAAVPNAVAAAQHRIDQLLRVSPLLNADILSEGLYSLDVLPLRILFEVNDDDCLVRVAGVSLLP